ncbi:autotransporter-associated beta strand repeat-containing protein [Achromobacter anxifer]
MLNNLTVNVANGATVYSSQAPDLYLGGDNVTFTNSGMIGPTLLGILVDFSSGVVLGNANSSTATITNNGIARAIGDVQPGNLFDLTGMAYEVKNGANGTVNFTNNYVIDAAPLITAGMVPAADIPAIIVYNPSNGAAGAGAKVNFTNNLGATIVGRIAFQGSATGNTFINAGMLNGSLSMGAGGATANTFIAVTGSSVQSITGITGATGVAGRAGLQFAAAGLVDGGVNGANTLVLQNVAAADNPGSGSAGTGIVSSTIYKNFPNLKVNSGTWTISGPLLSGFASPTAELNGGIASFSDASVFGTATVAANGGTLRSLGPSLNLANAFTLGTRGLTLDAFNPLTLSGQLSGSGTLTKNGTGMLVLDNAANDYSGGTTLNSGTLALGSAAALGRGDLSVNGASNLQSTTAQTLGTAIKLGATLSVLGGNDLVLSGNISGNGGLAKNGASTLTLTGINDFLGGVALNAGTLLLDNGSALGKGTLTTAAGTTLGASNNMTATNPIGLNGDLTINGRANLSLNGVISGSGNLTKNDSSILRLAGANTFQGNVLLNAGTLYIGNADALGQGRLIASGGTVVDTQTARTVANGITLNGALAVGGLNELTLQGVIDGNGSLTKNGIANLSLTGVNRYSGGTTLNAGSITVNNAGALGSGDLTVGGAARLIGSAPLSLGNAIHLNAGLTLPGSAALTLGGMIDGAAGVAKSGTGTLTLSGSNTYSGGTALADGTLIVGSNTALGTGVLATVNGAALDNSAAVSLANDVTVGSGSLNVLGSHDLTLKGKITGTGGLTKSGLATLTLAGANTYVGNTQVNAGALLVDGSVSGAVTANSGGTLGGNGRIGGGAEIASGATLSPGHAGPGTLTVNGNLTLHANSATRFELGQAGAVGGVSNDLVSVGGNLALDGALTANAASAGWYRLFNYDGSLSGSFASTQVNSTQSGFTPRSHSLDTSTAGQINLSVVDAGQRLQFWNGGQTSGTGSIAGGAGTWSASGTNWTDSAGTATQAWSGSVAVFGGSSGGNVSVAGTQSFDTLQFSTNGYNLAGGSLAFSPASGTQGTINTDAGISAAIATTIVDGSGTSLLKVGGGTLTLSGSNTYSGGTTVAEGTLVAAGNNALGSGAVTVDNTAGRNATLRIDSGVTLANTVTLTHGGGLNNAGTLAGNLLLDSSSANHVRLQAGSQILGNLDLGSNLGSTLTLEAAGNAVQLHTQAVRGNTSMAGGLVKSGTGTWVIDQDLAPAATTIANGTLQLGNGGTAGSLGAGGVANNGTLAIARSDAITLANPITGNGNLVQQGAGTTTLTGTNNYAGGTTISAGKLIASAASLGSGAITNNAALELNQASDATLAQAIGGTGSLTKTGAGSLTLAGANTYTGTTAINAGKLVASVANLGSGAITNNATLELNQASDATLAQAIGGNGSLIKTGSGRLTLTGDSSAFAGSTQLNAGTLALNAGAALGGKLTVASGASLSGSGAIGSTTLASGSVIAPGSTDPSGHAYGTLTVNGDLTFQAGSSYQIHADPASNASDRIAVTGTASLAGGVLHVGPEAGFDAARTYTILTASAVNGTFNTVSSNYAYLNPLLSYGDQQVKLQLQRKQTAPSTPVAFADAAITSNQRSVAHALDSLPSGNALHKYILTLPEGAPPEVFNSLSGEAHASVVSSLLGGTSSPRTLPMQRLRMNLNAGMSPGAPTAQAGGPLPVSALPSSNAQPAWAELVGNWQTLKENGNAAQVRQHTGGLFIGADHEVSHSGWRLGAAVGYTDSKINVDDRSSQADVSAYSATLYGGKSFAVGAGQLNFLAGAAYTWHDVNTKRYATVAGTQEKLTADYGANTTQLFTELGYSIPLTDRTRIEPFAGLAWSDLRTRGFSESGGSAALNGRSSSDKQTSSTLGLRTQTDFSVGRAEARLHAMAGWRHAFGSLSAETTMAFEGSQAFTVAGTPIARNAALAELGAEVAVSRDTTLALSYNGQYGGGNREHAGSLNVRWRY